jgi:hypothetical protein
VSWRTRGRGLHQPARTAIIGEEVPIIGEEVPIIGDEHETGACVKTRSTRGRSRPSCDKLHAR